MHVGGMPADSDIWGGKRPRFTSRRIDRLIAWLAERQHGVVGSFQLLDLGIERSAIKRRIAAGRLHRIHAGVFAVGHRKLTREGRFLAAVLAGGGDARLGFASAGALWGFARDSGDVQSRAFAPEYRCTLWPLARRGAADANGETHRLILVPASTSGARHVDLTHQPHRPR